MFVFGKLVAAVYQFQNHSLAGILQNSYSKKMCSSFERLLLFSCYFYKDDLFGFIETLTQRYDEEVNRMP